MSIKNVVRFIYWNIMPLIIAAWMFYYLSKIHDFERSFIMAFLFLVLFLVLIVIQTIIGNLIFKRKKTLLDKIMMCELRRKNGPNYCPDCPDSYVCAK